MDTGAITDLDVYRIIVRPRFPNDPRSLGFLREAHALGLSLIANITCHDLYFVEGELSGVDLERLALELLSDPVVQIADWGRHDSYGDTHSTDAYQIEVTLRPGVTDPVAEQTVRAAKVLGINGVKRVSTGQQFIVSGQQLTHVDLHILARRLLANPTIQHYAIGLIQPVFPHPAEASGEVVFLAMANLDAEGLLKISQDRRAALDLAEMQAIQTYFLALGRDPTDVEFETIAQTWSEHCVHKTFKARIEVQGLRSLKGASGADSESHYSNLNPPIIDGLLKTYIRSATEKIAAEWVRSAFIDNAGIIDFDDEYEVSFKLKLITIHRQSSHLVEPTPGSAG
jgi:phosphoribosylformylglycinamidine synthase